MAYNISKTDGTDLVTVADGTVDTNFTSLTLIGKNFAGYGDFLNENLVHMVENFANTTEPRNPLEGQLWWDRSTSVLKVRNSGGWKSVSATTAATSAPSNSAVGDLWWDATAGQLKAFAGGVTWVTIGPSYTSTMGQTGVVADSVIESNGTNSHVIVKFMVGSVCVAIMSKDPAFQVNTLGGYTWLKPGITFSSLSNYAYYGDASNALQLGGIPASSYLRSDIGGVVSGPVSIQSPAGLKVGAADDLSLSAASGDVLVASKTINKNMALSVNMNGVQTTLLTLSATNGLLAPTPTASSDAKSVVTKEYLDGQIGGASSVSLRRDGTNTITGTLLPQSTTLNFGSSTSHFANIYATNFKGLADNSTLFGGLTVSQFVRSDAPSNMTAPLVTTSNSGLTVGAQGDFQIEVTPSAINLKSTVVNKSLIMHLNQSNTLIPVLTFTSSGLGEVRANPTSTLGIATKGYVDSLLSGGAVDLSNVNGNIVPSINNTFVIGTDPAAGGRKWKAVYATNFYGNASSANYADLAERFHADKSYLPGTVVELGGPEEITAASEDLSDNVFGVISTNAAYLMNAGAGTNDTHPPIAMQGRVPVRVIGKVRKGDRLVSAGNGLARAAIRGEFTSFNVIGRALESKDTTIEGVIEAIVKLNS